MNTPDVGDHAKLVKKKRKRNRKWHLRLSRDIVIFATGIVGILHEIFLSNSDRPYLLVLFGAMIGLPAFLHIDERGKGADDK